MKVPRNGTAVAYLALFVALGGTAYAANTVGSDDIIDESIQSVDIKNQTITTKDIAGAASRQCAGDAPMAGAPGPSFLSQARRSARQRWCSTRRGSRTGSSLSPGVTSKGHLTMEEERHPSSGRHDAVSALQMPVIR